MIYVISGTSRSGKTMMANKILEEKKIPYMSLDWLVMGFTNGIPEYGIHDKLFPDEIAKKFWSFLEGMCENMIWTDKDYVLEGEAVLPELISELTEKYPDRIRVCFVGYTDIDIEKKVEDVKRYSTGENDWLSNKNDEYISNHITNMVEHSKMIMKDCKDYNLKYFDTSKDFIPTLNRAIDYLFECQD
jgi:adenylate kinase family enzyme